MSGEVVGAIKVDRKPRARRTPKEKALALDKRIEKAEAKLYKLKQLRANLVAEARAALNELESLKP
jgi:hypothetical protein